MANAPYSPGAGGYFVKSTGAGTDADPYLVCRQTLDGDDASAGAKADAAASSDAGTFSLIALFKRLLVKFTGFTGTAGSSATAVISVQGIASGTGMPVTGTFFQGTQPVSLASVPSHPVTVATQVGAGNMATSQVTVTTASGQLAASRATRRSITITNHGTTAVFFDSGTATVTKALLPGVLGASITLNVTTAVNAIVATGTQIVSVIEEFDS